MLQYTTFKSPIGELLIAGNEQSVTQITRDADEFIALHAGNAAKAKSGSFIDRAASAVKAYLRGETTDLSVFCEPEGTVFQRQVWQALSEVPYGTTVSYTEIAKRIGKPKAFRAVGNACGQNRIPVIIPCHRVVHKSGKGYGFTWGVETKQFLLDLEARHSAASLAA